MSKNSGRYSDIIDLPHHQSIYRPHMTVYNRAAQFAPYAALKGFEELVEETARTTQKFIEPDEGIKEEINRKLRYLADNAEKDLLVTLTYFQKDSRKDGGAYINHTGIPLKIKEFEKEIIFDDGFSVSIDSILTLELSEM